MYVKPAPAPLWLRDSESESQRGDAKQIVRDAERGWLRAAQLLLRYIDKELIRRSF